jgi:hypothetical protein
MAMTKATGPVRAYFNVGTTVESCATCARSCKREDNAPCYEWVEPTSSDPLLFHRMERESEAALMAYIQEWDRNWADAEHRP